MRRLSVLAAVSVAAAALFYTATAAPSAPSPDAPQSLSRPFVERTGSDFAALQISPQFAAWNQRVRGPIHTGWGSPRAGIVGVLARAIERYRQQG